MGWDILCFLFCKVKEALALQTFHRNELITFHKSRTKQKGPLLYLKKPETKGILVISRIDRILSGFLPFLRQVQLFASKISVHIIFLRESKTLTPQNTQ